MSTYEEKIIPIKISQLAGYVAKVKRISLDDALVYIYVNPMYKPYCLENYAISKRISGLSAWTIFKESGADDYVIENYDLLHTQGLEYLLDDIQRFIKRRKR